MSRFRPAGAAVELFVGLCLLLASCLFAFSAEYPTSIFEFCTNIAAVFSPTVTVAILTIPALFATIRYLAPERTWRSIVPMLLCGALFMTPVVPGVTSWSLYFFFGMTGALLVAKGIDPLCGDVVVATARKAWDSIARIPWPLFVFAAVAIHLTLSIAICFWWFSAVPHAIDSVAQLFQAKIIAGGALTNPKRSEDFAIRLGEPISYSVSAIARSSINRRCGIRRQSSHFR